MWDRLVGRMLFEVAAAFAAVALLYGLLVPCLGFVPDHQPYKVQAGLSLVSHVHSYGDEVTQHDRDRDERASGDAELSRHDGGMGQGSLALSSAVYLIFHFSVPTLEPVAHDAPASDGDVPAPYVVLPKQPPRI